MSSLFRTLSQEQTPLHFEKKDTPPKAKNLGFKIAVVFSFIVSIIALAGAGLLRSSLETEKNQREALEAAQTQLREKADAFEKSSKDYQKQIEDIQGKLKAYETEKQDLQKQLETGKARVEELTASVKSLEERNRALEENARKAQSETESSESTAEGAAPAPAPADAASLSPRVLTVNRKFNFAVVNAGLQQKLKIGDVIEVLRDGKPVARLQVEKLYESFCAASITSEPKDAPIQEGDAVRLAV